MKAVTVFKNELVEKLEKNLKSHEENYVEAMEGYKEEVLKVLNEKIKTVESGKVIDSYLRLSTPESHVKDYERAIGMLKMSTTEQIEITADEYDRYIMDEWEWKDSFLNNTMVYSKKFK